MRGRRIKKTTICIVITVVTCLLVYFHNTLSADEDGTAKSVLRRQINQGQHLSRPTHISQKTIATDQNKSVVKKYNTTTKSETKHQDTRKSNEKYRGVPQNRKRVVKRHGRQHKRFGGSYSLDLRRRPVILADELDIDADWWRAFTELTDDLKAVKKEYRCSYMEPRGNWWDCNSYPYKARKPCLVYSFGIDNDFRFDDEMATLGCEVHSFDPSMNVTEHKRESGVFFHKIGIGGSDDNMFRPWSNEYTINRPNNTWKIRTLASIMSKLGHRNKSLDILKLDIEGYEWEVLDSIIGDNLLPQIKQLEVEFHVFPNFPPRRDYVSALQVYQALWELDFKRYYSAVHQYHPNKDKPHLQADVAYVNTNYK